MQMSIADYYKREESCLLLKVCRFCVSGKRVGDHEFHSVDVLGTKVPSNLVVLDVQSLTLYLWNAIV